MKAIIQCDFDGTVILNNMSGLLRASFAGNEWQKVDEDYLAGKMSVEESNSRQFLMIKEKKHVLQSFILQNISIRPGFLDFILYCRENGLIFTIVSSGLDFYIETVLTSIDVLNVEVYCARTHFGPEGINVRYFNPQGREIVDGFKQEYFTWLKNKGLPVIYIGDGLSDLGAAKAADHVFATGHLQSLLQEISIRYYPFTTFYDISEKITQVFQNL